MCWEQWGGVWWGGGMYYCAPCCASTPPYASLTGNPCQRSSGPSHLAQDGEVVARDVDDLAVLAHVVPAGAMRHRCGRGETGLIVVAVVLEEVTGGLQ